MDAKKKWLGVSNESIVISVYRCISCDIYSDIHIHMYIIYIYTHIDLYIYICMADCD